MMISKLIRNMIDQMVEAQIKLGYSKETITLYYPLDSLNRILATSYETGAQMAEALMEAFRDREHSLGEILVTAQGDRLGVVLPPEAGEYVHNKVEKPAFLVELIQLFGKNHHCTIEEIKDLFDKFSKNVLCEKMPENAEFDYVLSFPEKDVDNYFYCIRMEMGHTIYHRFLEEDYKMLL